MPDATQPESKAREGGCRCGRVRFRVTAEPLLTIACHCTGCQRMTASAFSLSAAIPDDGFAVIAGEPVIGGLHGDDVRHYCCPHCMSWLFSRSQRLAGFVNLRPTMLDDHSFTTPFLEMQTAEKLSWATTPAVHSFERFPPMEAFPELIKAYVAQAAASEP